MKILWIAGWASSFEMWKSSISENFDGEHTFTSPHQESKNTGDFDLVICWSLGIHHLPKDLNSTKVLMINPAIDFCNSDGGVHPKILNRMIKQIENSPQDVLKSFAINCGFNESDAQTWTQNALSISMEKLIEGLNQLKTLCELDSKHQYALLQSKNDNIVSCSFNRNFVQTSEPSILSKEIPGSHLIDFEELKAYLGEINWI